MPRETRTAAEARRSTNTAEPAAVAGVPDARPIRLETVRLGDRVLRLTSPRDVAVRVEEGVLVAEIEELELVSYAPSGAELRDSLTEDLFMLWDDYAQAPDEDLTRDAIELKQAVRAFLQGAE